MVEFIHKFLQHRFRRLGFFILLALTLRFPSFFRSVIDHDESTYLVIADAVRNGAMYWVDVIDVKPVGIFWLLGALLEIVGRSVFWMRVLAALFLAFTAFLLSQMKLRMGSSLNAALAAGVIYLVLNSVFTFYGLSPNTETYFNLFTITGFYLALRFRNPWVFFPAGLFLGYGFLIKYVVLFDGVALGMFLLFGWFRERSLTWSKMGGLVLLAAGFILPFAATYLYYLFSGQGDTFLFYTFEVSGRYPEAAGFWDFMKSFLDVQLRFFPVFFFFYFALFRLPLDSDTRRLGVLWTLLVLVPIFIPGKFFGHYFIQLFLPVSFLAGEFFGRPGEAYPRFVRFFTASRATYWLVGLMVVGNWLLQKRDYIDRPDVPAQMAREIKKRQDPGDVLYLGNYHPIIYFMLGKKSPTPYIHRGLLWTEEHLFALNIDQAKEVGRILASKPDWVVVQDSLFSPKLNDEIRTRYRRVSKMKTEKGHDLYLYQRNVR